MKRGILSLLAPALGLAAVCAPVQAATTSFDEITDARAMAAKDVLEYSMDLYQSETEMVRMYTSTEMDDYIEKDTHLGIISKKDQCQFTPDIEDRARIVGMPVFQHAFADMLITGTCVKKDVEQGLMYFNRAIRQGYAPSMVKMAYYYEKGFYVSRDPDRSHMFLKAAVDLGSVSGRLAFADMLIRGYGDPSMYEDAYKYLYHTQFHDLYTREKSRFLMHELQKKMPPNIVARAAAYHLAID